MGNNKNAEDADDRGYFPVERWILSMTAAENDKRLHNEGLSRLILKDPSTSNTLHFVLLKDLVHFAGKQLVVVRLTMLNS